MITRQTTNSAVCYWQHDGCLRSERGVALLSMLTVSNSQLCGSARIFFLFHLHTAFIIITNPVALDTEKNTTHHIVFGSIIITFDSARKKFTLLTALFFFFYCFGTAAMLAQ